MRTKRLSLLGLIICVTLVAVSCSLPPEQASKQSADPLNIDCQVFYRASAGESLSKGPPVTLAQNSGLEVVTFKDLEFSAQYSGDQFEG